MKYPELSERTIRQRRNVLVMSVLILAIKTFGINVTGVSVSAAKLENLDITAIAFILGGAIVYSSIAAIWNGWNEFQHWRVVFKNEPNSGYGGAGVKHSLINDISNGVREITQGISQLDSLYKSVQNTISATPQLPDICEKFNAQIPRVTEGTDKIIVLCNDYQNHIVAFSRSVFWRFLLLEAAFPLLLAGFALASTIGLIELCGIGAWIRDY